MSRLKVATETDATPCEHPPLDHEDASAIHALLLAAQVAEELGDCADIRAALLIEVRRTIRREQFLAAPESEECPSP